jgi:hypothetical protein
MTVLSLIKAPWAVQLYRCLFIATIIYFGSFLWEFRNGTYFPGLLIIGSFPFCGSLGLVFTFIQVSWSRWIIASFGILILAIVAGALFLRSPYEGWFDALGGLLIWCLIVLQPVIWALALFKDKKTKIYFRVVERSEKTLRQSQIIYRKF